MFKLRHSQGVPPTSGAGGRADGIHPKADYAAGWRTVPAKTPPISRLNVVRRRGRGQTHGQAVAKGGQGASPAPRVPGAVWSRDRDVATLCGTCAPAPRPIEGPPRRSRRKGRHRPRWRNGCQPDGCFILDDVLRTEHLKGMSKGLGQVQHSILAVFDAAPDDWLYSMEIAGRALERRSITESEASSYRRALRSLADAGVIVDMGRKWHEGRRYYALPAAADRYNRQILETLGKLA